jgi:hypothetical protein
LFRKFADIRNKTVLISTARFFKITAPQARKIEEDAVPGGVGIELGITARREVAQEEAQVAGN